MSTSLDPRSGERTPLLAVSGLTVRYSGVVAINDVSFELPAGSFTGLIGPNGAGKTSMIDALTGYARVADGSILFKGRELRGRAPHLRARAGLSRTFQSVELFDDLTVEENLLVAIDPPGPLASLRRLVVTPRRNSETLDYVVATLELSAIVGRYPRELSHGQRKLVGVGRALASRPSLLLLDEPAAGLDTAETEALGHRLRELPAAGVSVLLIDHDMGLVLSICDSVLVLNFGEVIAHASPAVIRQDTRVIEAYLGGSQAHSGA